jgi:hypothetical protein
VFGGIQLFEIGAGSAKLIWEDTFPMCSQTGTRRLSAGSSSSCAAAATRSKTRKGPWRARAQALSVPDEPGLPADVPDSSAISRAIFPKSEFEGQVNADEATRRVAIANRMFKIIRVYDFSDKERPSSEVGSAPLKPERSRVWKGLVVLPGGYSGLLLERGHAR